MATVPGIDVSYWNAGIDWPKVRATGQRFAITKATEGITYKDPTFNNNWSGAKAAGLLRGAYHFFRCNVDAQKQADYFINYVKTVKDNGDAGNAALHNPVRNAKNQHGRRIKRTADKP